MASLPPAEIQYQLAHRNENRVADIITANTIMLVAAYIAVGLRFMSRRLMHATLDADDWMMVVGLFFTSCFVAGCYVCVSFGMGKHAILLTKPVAFAKATLTTEVLYTPASTCIKFSVLLLYRRLFPNKTLKIVSWCIVGFLVVFALAQMLSVIIQCTPVAALWDPLSHPNAVCDDYAPALVLFAAVNAATDITVLCLPLPILWHLNASKTRRRQLVGIFLLGGLVCVVSLCRTGYVHQVSLTDPSWDDVNTVILSAVENCAGVVSGCLPTLLPIWQYLRHGKSLKPMQQTTNESTSKQDTGTRLSVLKGPMWPTSRPRELEKKHDLGSFVKLHDSATEVYSGNRGYAGDVVPKSILGQEPNRIKVTTNLQQSRAVAPQEGGMEETTRPEW